MVRRGSTVRVRQRALEKSRKAVLFLVRYLAFCSGRTGAYVQVGASALELARTLGVGYSSQDWVVARGGSFFLDINPGGQWLFLPKPVSSEVTAAIAARGLSMDYHVFILSRVKELVDGGMNTGEAVAAAIKRTALTVTSAAVVMVAVFAIFATLQSLDMKQRAHGGS